MQTCKQCHSAIIQKRFSSGVLECPSMMNRRKFCDQKCMAKWQQDRMKVPNPHNSHRQSARKVKSTCETCGATTKLHVHHKDREPMNNSSSNLQTLCAKCHREAHSPHFSVPGARVTCRLCEKPAMRVGLCWMHNTRLKSHGDPLVKKIKIGSKYILHRETTDGFERLE